MERPGGDPNPVGAITFQTSQDIYEYLSGAENGRLGNAYTKRFIRISNDPSDFSYISDIDTSLAEKEILVYMRITQTNSVNTQDFYLFRMGPRGDVVHVKSWQGGADINTQEQTPASSELFTKELQAARKIQQTLIRK